MAQSATDRAVPASPTPRTLAPAPGVGQPILTGSRAVPNNAPLVKRLLNIRLEDHLAKLILVAAASYCNPWSGGDGGVCLAANHTLWELAETTRRHFYERWAKLKRIGIVEIRRRGPGKTAEVIIRAAPIRAVPGTAEVPPGGEHGRIQAARERRLRRAHGPSYGRG